MTMTDEEYCLVYEGSKCPACYSKDIEEEDDLEVEGTKAWQTIKCNTCGSTWTDCYELIGFSDLNNHSKPTKDIGDWIKETEENKQ